MNTLTQEQVNELYRQKYVTPPHAALLIAKTRQFIWYLIKEEKLKTYRVDGQSYVDTQSLKEVALAYKKELLDKVGAIMLPTEF